MSVHEHVHTLTACMSLEDDPVRSGNTSVYFSQSGATFRRSDRVMDWTPANRCGDKHLCECAFGGGFSLHGAEAGGFSSGFSEPERTPSDRPHPA